jgi:chromosome partitioning protein
MTDGAPDAFVLATQVEHLSLIPADRNLTGAEIEMVPMLARERRLQRVLDPLRSRFEFIFIDCPPSLGLLTLNALVAADAVLIPLHCEYFALEGLADLVGTMRPCQRSAQSVARYRRRAADDVRRSDEPRSARCARRSRFLQGESLQHDHSAERPLGEAPSHGMPGVLYDTKSRGRRGLHRARKGNAFTPRRSRGVMCRE